MFGFLWDSYRGVYSLNTAKQAGVWQTWKEGFATYFGQRVQKYLQDTLIDIPYVNDEKYTAANGVEHSMIGKLYPGENSKGGESNETVVCQVLYQITDHTNSSFDTFNYDDKELFDNLVLNNVKTFSDFYDWWICEENYDYEKIASFLYGFKVFPNAPEVNFVDNTMSIKLDKTNESDFFVYDTFKIILGTPNRGKLYEYSTNQINYTIPSFALEDILYCDDVAFFIVVGGAATKYYETTMYYSMKYYYPFSEFIGG